MLMSKEIQEYLPIIRKIQEQCAKLYYDEANFWADYLYGALKDNDVSSLIYGRVLSLQSRHLAAIPIFKKCHYFEGQYHLAASYLHIGQFNEAKRLLKPLASNRYTLFSETFPELSSALPMLFPEIQISDVNRCISLACKGTGDEVGSAKASIDALNLDPYLVQCARDLHAYGHILPRDSSKNSGCIDNDTRTIKKGKILSKRSLPSLDVYEHLPDAIKYFLNSLNDDDGNNNDNTDDDKTMVPSTCFSRATRAFLLYERGHYLQSKVEYIKIIEENPYFYCDYLQYLPIVLWHLKDVETLQRLASLWQKDPTMKFVTYLAEGNLFSLSGDQETAIKAFKKASDILGSDSVLPMLLIGHELLSFEEYDEAGRIFAEILAIQPNCGKALLGIGVASYRLGRFLEAKEFLTQAAYYLPKSPAVHIYLSSVCLAYSKGALDEALGEIEKALLIDPKNLKGLYTKASLLLKLGRREDCNEILKALLRLAPTEAAGHRLLGECLQEKGDLAETLKALNAAAELAPDDQQTIQLLERIIRK